jgi:hypothetical protein
VVPQTQYQPALPPRPHLCSQLPFHNNFLSEGASNKAPAGDHTKPLCQPCQTAAVTMPAVSALVIFCLFAVTFSGLRAELVDLALLLSELHHIRKGRRYTLCYLTNTTQENRTVRSLIAMISISITRHDCGHYD